MAARQTDRFVAKGRRDVEVPELDSLLAAYDRSQAKTDASPEPAAERAAEWADDFVAHRETVLRPVLETVAWKLEGRDHHPWVEDLTPTDPSQRREFESHPRGIALRFLAPGGAGPANAAALRFEPRPDHGCVQVSTRLLGPGAEVERDGTYGLDELTDEKVFDLAIQVIRRALFGEQGIPLFVEPPDGERQARGPQADAFETTTDAPSPSAESEARPRSGPHLPFLDYTTQEWDKDWQDNDPAGHQP